MHTDQRDLCTFPGFACLYLHCDLKQSCVVSVTKSGLNEDPLWAYSPQSTGLLPVCWCSPKTVAVPRRCPLTSLIHLNPTGPSFSRGHVTGSVSVPFSSAFSPDGELLQCPTSGILHNYKGCVIVVISHAMKTAAMVRPHSPLKTHTHTRVHVCRIMAKTPCDVKAITDWGLLQKILKKQNSMDCKLQTVVLSFKLAFTQYLVQPVTYTTVKNSSHISVATLHFKGIC